MTATTKPDTRRSRRQAKKRARAADKAAPENRSPAPQRLETPSGTTSKVPQVIVLIFMIAAGILAFVAIYTSSVDREPTLVMGANVERGQVLTANDLRIEYLSGDGNYNRLPDTDAALVVGQIAVRDLNTGDLISTADVAPTLRVAPGEAIIGLALDPGGYPVELVTGDRVDVFVTSSLSGSNQNRLPPSDTALVEGAEVFASTDLANNATRKLISLRIPDAAAGPVAQAAAAGQITLVVVPEENDQ